MKKTGKTTGIIDRVLLPHTAWALLLLIPITYAGFYPSYYSTFEAPLVIHVHGVIMALWLSMVIIQPWLIKTNKFGLHRLVGKISYILMPCNIIVGYFVLRHGFQRVVAGDIVAPVEYYPAGSSPITKGADFVVIGSMYMLWLLLYYLLGVVFRRKIYAHATFMLAAALTILGPSGDRLIGLICDLMGWEFNALAENFTFGIIIFVFSALLIHHKKINQSGWPTIAVLSIHTAGVILYYVLPFNKIWERLAEFMFSTF